MATVREKYADNTRQALLDSGLRLFVERGYAQVSAEELVRAAGLTRGALYHHFDGKRGLFEALFDDLERDAGQRIEDAVAEVTDPLERVYRGIDEFLEICTGTDFREIAMLQGPIALGWQRWRELDQQRLGRLVLDAVGEMLNADLIKPHPAELIASALFGMLTELCAAIAESSDPQEAKLQATALVRDLIGGLARR